MTRSIDTPAESAPTLRTGPTVTAKGIRRLVELALSAGAERAGVLERTGIAAEELDAPEGRIPRDCVRPLWDLLGELLDDPAVALTAAKAVPFGTYDVLDYAFATSTTVEEGLGLVVRYFRLALDEAEFEFEVGPDVARCRYRLRNDDSGLEPFSAEFAMAILADRLASCADHPPWTPTAMRFVHSRTEGLEAFNRTFGVEVEFGAEFNELVVPASLARAPMRRAEPGLNRVLDTHAAALTAELAPIEGFDGVVRRELYRAISEGDSTPAMDDVARRLGLGARTLQRRLQEEETSYGRVLDEMRYDLAVRFLRDPSMAIGEVGFLLGFSEPSAFNRAFRRWDGQTPGAFRRRVLKGDGEG